MANSKLKEKTAKGIFWGGLGNGLQQILSLCFGIFLARTLNAKDYGMIGMLTIFTAIAGVLLDGGFAAALINKQDAKQEDYNAVFWFNVVMGISIYIILFFCAPFIAGFYHTPALVPLSRFIFLGFVFGCTGTVHGAILTKKLMVKQKSLIHVTAIFISGVASVVMVFNGFGYWGLAVQSVGYVLITVFLQWIISPWRPTFQFSKAPLKQMLPFSFKIAITNIFNQLNQNIISTLLGKFYTPQQVGYFTQGNKWEQMGGNFVNSMVSGVAQPVMATVSDDIERQRNIFRKMLRFTAFISFPAMFILALVSKEIIIITITAKWMPSIIILQMLCLWGALAPINGLYSNLIISRGNSKVYMWNTISLGVLQVLAMIFSASHGINCMIIVFIIINTLWIGVWNIFAWRAIRMRFIYVLKDICPFFFITLIAVLPAYLITMKMTNLFLSVAIKVIVSVSVYLIIMKCSGSVIYKESREFLLSRIHKKK